MEDSRDVTGVRARLLFLVLFVVGAAAQCPKPQGTENTVLTEEALLMNDFPGGTVVTLECAKGHVKDGGSGVTTCTDNTWSEPDLVCKKKDCGPPEPQENMKFNTSAGTLFGAIIGVYCEKGYQISGMSYKQCYASGWSGRATCEVVTCDEPPEVANGRRSWDTQDAPKYGETIQYTCDEGYTLTGLDTIACSESGEYDSQPPECKGVTTVHVLPQTPTFLAQETPTSAGLPATPTAPTDQTVRSTAAPAASSEREGGGDVSRTETKGATAMVTSTTPSSLQGNPRKTEVTNSDVDYIPVIVSVTCVSLVVCVVAFSLHKYLLRRKGSASGMVPLC